MRCLIVTLLCACTPGATTLRIGVSVDAGQATPQTLLIRLYGPNGRLASDFTVDQQHLQLPGNIEVQVAAQIHQVRVALIGTVAGGLLVSGAARITTGEGEETRASIGLSSATADRDRDDVPDLIDNCGDTANADQADANSDGVGDACASGSDLGHQLLLGDPNVEASVDSHTAGLADISAFQAVAGGTVTQLAVYLSAASTTDKLLVGLYDDNGLGHPRSLITSGVIDNPISDAWNTAGVPPIAVTSGATYFIAMVSPVGHGDFNFPYGSKSGPSTEHSLESNLTQLPASWSSGDTFPGTFCSYYATR